jgi:carbon storage regulator
MLVLSRKLGEEIIINGDIVVKVTDIGGGQVRLGITAPRDVPVLRSEIAESITSFREPEKAAAPARRDGRWGGRLAALRKTR